MLLSWHQKHWNQKNNKSWSATRYRFTRPFLSVQLPYRSAPSVQGQRKFVTKTGFPSVFRSTKFMIPFIQSTWYEFNSANASDPSQNIYTGYTQKNGAVSKGNKKFISHLTRAQRTPSAAAAVQVSHTLPSVRFPCLLRGRGASFQDGVAAGKDFLCAPFWGVQICDYSAARVSCTV